MAMKRKRTGRRGFIFVSIVTMALMMALVLMPLARAEIDTGQTTFEDAVCPDANVFSNKMISNVCWDCLFPIRIAGFNIADQGSGSPQGAAGGFCYCPGCGYYGRFGVTLGMWQPARLVEVTSQPYCMPALGGITMSSFSSNVSRISFGKHQSRQAGNEDRSTDGAAAHFHYYTYPILAILGLMDSWNCIDSGYNDFDLLWVSEIFPNWTDDTLAAFLNPEQNLFANPAAALAQPIDCIASTAYRPSNSLFWMAGCWGSHFPLSGYLHNVGSPVRAASLRVSRALFMLHRIGVTKRQGGSDAVCDGEYEAIMTKSMYRAQQFWPMPETGSGSASVGGGSEDSPFNVGSMLPVCCHALGASVLAWGDWRTIPIIGEDYLKIAWRWNDCCVGVCI